MYGKRGVRSGKKGVRSFVMFDTRTVDYDRQICFWVEYKIGICKLDDRKPRKQMLAK